MNSQPNIYKNKKPVFFFLLPAFLFLALYLFYPFVRNILNSFQIIKDLGAPAKGWNDPIYKNYAKLFTDKNMGIAMKNTLIMIVVTLLGQVGIALILSLMVDNIKRGAKFFRIVYFFPIVVSATALGLLFNLIFLYDKGMLNQFLGFFVADKLTDWKDSAHAMVTMLVPVMWQYVGFYFIILLTGLNNISDELYESAAIDGATTWQKVKYISLPLLHNVICTCSVLAVTGALKVFDLPWIMLPNGMPMGETWLTGTYMYYWAFQGKDIDYSCTVAIVIVILGILLSKVVNMIFKEKDY